MATRSCQSRPAIARLIAAGAMLWLAAGSAEADCAPPADGPPACLSGVVTSPDRRVALVAVPGQPGLLHLTEGAALGDWKVERIAPRSIVLRHDDQSVELALGEPGAAAPQPAPPVIGPVSAAPGLPNLRANLAAMSGELPPPRRALRPPAAPAGPAARPAPGGPGR